MARLLIFYYIFANYYFKKIFMTESEITTDRTKIISLIKNTRLLEAFSSLKKMLISYPDWEIEEKVDKLQTSYKYMLQYMANGINDPQKESILDNIILSLFSLTDRYAANVLATCSRKQFFAVRNDFKNSGKNLYAMFKAYDTELNNLNLYEEVAEEEKDKYKTIDLHRRVEVAERNLFNYVWTAFPMEGNDVATLKELLFSNDTQPQLKKLLIPAIYLNTNTFYQERLLSLLFELYSNTSQTDAELSVRALCCIFLLLNKYDYIVGRSKHIKEWLATLNDNETFADDMKIMIFQFVRSCDTDRLTKLVQNELMPKIMKISPDIINKFKNKGSNVIDISDLEANPEWEDILNKSGFSQKIKELNEIQMEGGDVFMGTFSHLKSFPFFYDIANWFIPFSDKHSVVLGAFNENNALIQKIITNARFLCDSDKYSFCLSVGSIPQMQRDSMISQFDSQNEAIEELQKNSLPDNGILHKQIANNFMQDLYRFFKLYNRRTQFEDPFDGSNLILDTSSLKDFIDKQETLSLIGEYYFKSKHYEIAIKYLNHLSEISEEFKPEIAQKIGFCYQNIGKFQIAIDYYLKYSLFKSDNLWNIKHIASCYRSMGETGKALEYYQKAESLKPDNVSTCLNIGHCLLEQNKIDEALKYYFKADYLDNNNAKSVRPIAWCLFIQKNFKQSEEYYEKLIHAASNNPEDFMNYGHLKMAVHDVQGAIACYRKSLELLNNDLERFVSNFEADKKYLIEAGISDQDANLIPDLLQSNL